MLSTLQKFAAVIRQRPAVADLMAKRGANRRPVPGLAVNTRVISRHDFGVDVFNNWLKTLNQASMKIRFALSAFLSSLLSAGSSLAQTTGSAGGGESFDNRQPTLAIQYIMAVQGAFPDHDSIGILQADRSQPFLAEIRPVAFGSPIPTGWVVCTGQVMAISQNIALFSILLTNYGGNGFSTFQFPNLSGRVPIGAGQGPGLPNYNVGETNGVEQLTLLTGNLPAHVHSTSGTNTGATGNNNAFNNLQPSLAVNFLISENGEITMFAGNYVPTGWGLCNGSTLNMADNPNLFDAIGTTYGGDGVTTFQLPDLRGRTPLGIGQRPGGSAYALGQTSGANTVTLATSQLPAHSHPFGGGNTGSTGGSAGFDNRQPSLAMKWLISSGGSTPDSPPPWPGELRLIAGNAAAGLGSQWLAADGTLLPIGPNTYFFSLVLTNYGGNGNSTFAVPDLRGRVAVGQGQAAGTSSYVLGQSGGSEAAALTTNQMPAHTHSVSVAPPVPPVLNSVTMSNGQFQFAFSNISGQTFTVLAATNVTLPLSNWAVLGPTTEGPAGQFKFTDSQTTTNAQRFYRARWP